MSTAHQFRELFEGRQDVWGAVHGECVRQPLTDELWANHLDGPGSIGVYPSVDNQVKWGCSDIDKGVDKVVYARNMWKALNTLGITSWVERTKSKGYHVWVFADGWTPAATMRNALLVAHQLAGVPPVEVNPKNVDTGTLAKQLGNYVNLPYARDWAIQSKRVVLDMTMTDPAPIVVDRFVSAAHSTRNRVDVLERAASLYRPPAPKPATVTGVYDGSLGDVVGRLNGLAYRIFCDGVLEGRDRSRTLQRLAHLCRESGLNAQEALAVVSDADGRWGKFAGRADGFRQLLDLVGNAYT